MSAAPPTLPTVGRCSRTACVSLTMRLQCPGIPTPSPTLQVCQRQQGTALDHEGLSACLGQASWQCSVPAVQLRQVIEATGLKPGAPGDGSIMLLVHRHPQRQHLDRFAVQLRANPLRCHHPARPLRCPCQLHHARRQAGPQGELVTLATKSRQLHASEVFAGLQHQ